MVTRYVGRPSRLQTLRRVLLIMKGIEALEYLPSIDYLAEEHDVSRRTIFRDLEILREVGCRVPPAFTRFE